MNKFFAGIAITIILYLAVINRTSEPPPRPQLTPAQIERKEQAEEASHLRWQVLWWSLTGAVCLAAGGGVWWVLGWGRNKWRFVHAQNGVFPVAQINTATLKQRLQNIKQMTFVPMDMLGQEAATVTVANGATSISGGRNDWTSDHQLQMAMATQRTRMMSAMSGENGIKYAAQAKLAGGMYDRVPKVQHPQIEERPTIIDAIAQPSFHDALADSTPDRWLVGHNPESGIRLQFDTDADENIGIIGSRGTGKTASTGYHVIIQALQSGWHPIILDPKGGVDLKLFNSHCEWYDTDDQTWPDQIKAITDEHQRRQAMLKDAGASNISELPGNPLSHLLVVMEEYGAIWEDVERRLQRKAVAELDSNIDQLMRLSRATGIHWCIIDQQPEKWSEQVFGGIKFKLCYQVASSTASRLKEYEADTLPSRGWFMHRRNKYQSWHVKPQVREWLSTVPTSNYPQLIDGRSKPVHKNVSNCVPGRSQVYTPTPPMPMNGENITESDRWGDLVTGWFVANPYALTGPARGISEIARLMAEADGRPNDYENYKSVAHRMFHEFRKSARVNGAPFGTDTTHGG